jgi:NAD(P)-dependent dehydrogenase (short-subunit alcohol dehydrogenase family)
VTRDDSVTALRDRVEAEFGAPSIVVNSAGVYRIATFQQASLDDYRNAIEVYYLGCVRMMKTFLPAMVEAGYGRIVNIASTAGKYGSMYQAHYNGSKHAVVGITRSLGLEFAKTGVRINAICPGFVETPMLDRGAEEFARAVGVSAEEALQTWLSRVPIGRFLQPDEIVPLAVYLASRECDGMTGQAMTISGGMILV